MPRQHASPGHAHPTAQQALLHAQYPRPSYVLAGPALRLAPPRAAPLQAGAAHAQGQEELLQSPPPEHGQYSVTLYDLHDQQVPYEQAWAWQRALVAAVAGASAAGAPAGAVLLLQHPPVYTLGTGGSESNLKFDAAAPPLPLYRTERGGEVGRLGGAAPCASWSSELCDNTVPR